MAKDSAAERRAHDEGFAAGEMSSQLAAHARHLEKINGSTEKTALELGNLNMAMQHMTDRFDAAAATVIATADALKDAETARLDKVEHAWTPIQRFNAVAVGILAVLSIYAFFFYR
jgi:hypothetical protein